MPSTSPPSRSRVVSALSSGLGVGSPDDLRNDHVDAFLKCRRNRIGKSLLEVGCAEVAELGNPDVSPNRNAYESIVVWSRLSISIGDMTV